MKKVGKSVAGKKDLDARMRDQLTRMQAVVEKGLARERSEAQARKLQSIAVCILPALIQAADERRPSKEIIKFSVELAKSLVEETEKAVKK